MLRHCVPYLLTVILCSLPVSAEIRQAPVHLPQTHTSAPPDSGSRAGYVGDTACYSCHKHEALSYRLTSHHLTSQSAGKDTILGSFEDGSNILTISDPGASPGTPHLYFKMERKENGYYQTAIAENNSQTLTKSARIDLVIGSGVRGQTYLYWSGDELYELPVSYWSDGHQWINSPGYKDGTANFARHVDPRCLECHATYIKPLSRDLQTNLYDKTSLVTGISCESCHGPGEEHAAQKRSSSASRKPREHNILDPARFERDRQVDQCALCHNGTQREELIPAFSYLPDRPLDDYLAPNPTDTAEHPDVHGNQVGLLKRSRCYLKSPLLTCSTCHDVHAPELTIAQYSSRCLTCHQWKSCGVAKKLGTSITRNCIDCHMPMEQTNSIVSETAGRALRTAMRNHWIKVYPPSVN
jgi:Cytochrome c554 and c-prime